MSATGESATAQLCELRPQGCRAVSLRRVDGPGDHERPSPAPRPARSRLYANRWLTGPAVLVGLLLLVPVFIGALITLAGVAETNGAPNPFVGDEFFCCGHPDTWGEVGLGTLISAAAAATTAAILTIAVMLMANLRPDRTAFLMGPGLAAAFATAAITVGVVLDLGNLRSTPSCDTFTPDPKLLREDWSDRRHQEMVLGVDRCDALIGRSPEQIRVLFGFVKPGASQAGYNATPNYIDVGPLRIWFKGRRVSGTKITSPSGGGFND